MTNNKWELNFISEIDFRNHVRQTIAQYDKQLLSYDLKKFNSNLIDPIKFSFDKIVFNRTWEEIISNEIFRQRDKSVTNEIGYFHQNIFKYFNNCQVPDEGWDIVYENSDGILLPEAPTVQKVYIEMKNKKNTMNSSSKARTYIKMQHQLLSETNCACFLVEVLASKSQNIPWTTTIDKKQCQHPLIRQVSIDQLYSLVTGDKFAFFKMCKVLPNVIKSIVESNSNLSPPVDTVFEELQLQSQQFDIANEDYAIIMSLFTLGFGTYPGFQPKK